MAGHGKTQRVQEACDYADSLDKRPPPIKRQCLMAVSRSNFIKKETLAQVFSCEFCEISKNIFLIEHLWWLFLDLSFSKMKSGRLNAFSCTITIPYTGYLFLLTLTLTLEDVVWVF